MDENIVKEVDAIIAGVPKCGTTSLITYLYQHPEIYVPWNKEKETDLKIMDIEDKIDAPDNKLVITRDEHLIYSEEKIETIKKVNPDIRFIFSFRDPVRRTNSAYWFKVRNLGIKVSLKESLTHPKWKEYTLKQGEYKKGLRKFDMFPDENKYYVIAEELWDDLEGGLSDLYSFLGVDSDFVPSNNIYRNRSGAPRIEFIHDFVTGNRKIPIITKRYPELLKYLRRGANVFNLKDKPPLPDDVKSKLIKYYSKVNEDLDKMIGKDLSRWWDWWE